MGGSKARGELGVCSRRGDILSGSTTNLFGAEHTHMAVATPFLEKTDEQKAMTEMVRQFADEQIIPNAEHYDHEDEFPEPIVEKMKELGLFGVTIPEEYGGLGRDRTTHATTAEEPSRGWLSSSGTA